MIEEGQLPTNALLQEYARAGVYTDCFRTEILDHVTLAEYVEAFYTTWLFKLERVVLALLLKRPSSDKQAKKLALGEANKFAAWTVAERTQHQLLMRDFRNQTCSWFMVVPGRLYFGSAVTGTSSNTRGGLLGLHRLYSRMLLAAAKSRLQ